MSDAGSQWPAFADLQTPVYSLTCIARELSEMVSESEIWQIIQTGNEISVMRIELFITITVGVLIISSIPAIRLNLALLVLMCSIYLVFGYVNYSMTMSEMDILTQGITQLNDMVKAGEEVSYMGRYLATYAESPFSQALLPLMHASYWVTSVATVSYAIWRYLRRRAEVNSE